MQEIWQLSKHHWHPKHYQNQLPIAHPRVSCWPNTVSHCWQMRLKSCEQWLCAVKIVCSNVGNSSCGVLTFKRNATSWNHHRNPKSSFREIPKMPASKKFVICNWPLFVTGKIYSALMVWIRWMPWWSELAGWLGKSIYKHNYIFQHCNPFIHIFIFQCLCENKTYQGKTDYWNGGWPGGRLPKRYPYCTNNSCSFQDRKLCFVDQLYIYQQCAYNLDFDFDNLWKKIPTVELGYFLEKYCI